MQGIGALDSLRTMMSVLREVSLLGDEAGELGAGAGSARRPVVCFSGAQNEIPRIGAGRLAAAAELVEEPEVGDLQRHELHFEPRDVATML